MRYRRFGTSDLVVSEVGFGTWTLVTDWWGRTDHPHDDDHAPRSTPASTSSTPRRSTAPTARARRSSRRTSPCATTSCITTKCGYDIERRAQVPRPVGAPARLAARVDPPAVRRLAAPPRHRPHRPLPAAQPAHRADPRRRPLGRRCSTLQAPKARCASSASRSGPRSAGSRKATARSTTGRSRRCRRCSTCSSRSRAARSRQRPRVAERRGVADLARAARLRLALGQGHARHRVPDPATTARTATATTCSTTSRRPRRSSFLWEPETGPHDRAGRDRRHPRQPGVHVRAADRALGRRRRASTRPRPTCRSPTDEHDAGRRAVAAQLRPRRPLRDAAEVERLTASMRLPADERRQQLLAVACELFARTGFHDDVDGRHRGSRGRHQARAVPALPEQARAVRRAARRHRAPAARPPRRGDRAARRRAASGSRPASARTSSSRSATARRSACCSARRSAAIPSSRAPSTGSSQAAADTISTLIDIPTSDDQRRVLAYALVGMARVGRPARAAPSRRRDVDGDELAAWIAELAWFGLRGVRAEEPTLDRRMSSELAQPHAPHAVVGALLEHEVRALATRRDVLAQVREVDLAPHRRRRSRASSSSVERVRKLKYERGSCSDVSRSSSSRVDVPVARDPARSRRRRSRSRRSRRRRRSPRCGRGAPASATRSRPRRSRCRGCAG